MPLVERAIIVNADRQIVYSLASDMEQYPSYMEDVESVKVTHRNGNRTVSEWETSVDGTPIYWTEEDIFDDVNFVIEYKLIEGDLDKFEGAWRFEEVVGATKVTLSCDYDFGIPELANLIAPTLKEKVGENSQMMLEGIKKRAEASTA